MSKKETRRLPALKLAAFAVGCALAMPAAAQQLPELGSEAEPWKVDVYYDNHTAFRGKDRTGDRVGLSKFRNTLQVEAEKDLADDWAFRGILREVTGAAGNDRALRAAFTAGMARRAFLKGLGQGKGCAYPARTKAAG